MKLTKTTLKYVGTHRNGHYLAWIPTRRIEKAGSVLPWRDTLYYSPRSPRRSECSFAGGHVSNQWARQYGTKFGFLDSEIIKLARCRQTNRFYTGVPITRTIIVQETALDSNHNLSTAKLLWVQIMLSHAPVDNAQCSFTPHPHFFSSDFSCSLCQICTLTSEG